MSVMERRLQLLLDQARYRRVEEEARRSSRSVSAVIRGAIDVAYPPEDEARKAALQMFVDFSSATDEEPEEGWASIKESFDRDLVGGPQ
ncbi:MAG: hypothetical protein R2722_15475 [Tessaracoccus sp.]